MFNFKNYNKIIIIFTVLALSIMFSVVLIYIRKLSSIYPEPLAEKSPVLSSVSTTKPETVEVELETVDKVATDIPRAEFSWPLEDALTRVTKKPFGIYISPQDSPVSPEKFTGYHTGVDFETTAQEQEIDVPVYAICNGSLIVKKTATGYGGVAVESCYFEGRPVTIVYGHLKLSSIKASLSDSLKAGEQLGVLGRAYSSETDGERKHLHLGIYQSEKVNLLGYVSKKSALSQWLDILTIIK